MTAIEIDWSSVWTHLVLLLTAYMLAMPIGWNRERYARSAGLRTYPLVAVASCGFMLIGMEVLDSTNAEARIFEGIVTGMGFIGGGAILKGDRFVTGTATAASLWATGCIGLAVAWNRFEIALVLSLMTFATLQLVPSLKSLITERDDESEDVADEP